MSNVVERLSLREEVDREYFGWLVDLVDGDDALDLLHALDSYEFYATLEMDNNRGNDGIELRREFELALGYSGYIRSRNCTVLELLIGIASRMNELTQEIDEEPKIDEWFWELIINLNLHRDWPLVIDSVMEDFMDRNYDFDGGGGLFPLNDPETDQRELEIWYQMSQYLAENYFYE